MPGLPGDNFEIDIESAKKSIAMKPDICRIYPSLVIKDTPMEDMYNRGNYKPYSLDDAVYISGEMLKLYNEAKIHIDLETFEEYLKLIRDYGKNSFYASNLRTYYKSRRKNYNKSLDSLT